MDFVDVIKAFEALKGGDKALRMLPPVRPLEFGGIAASPEATVLVTPLRPVISSGPAPFSTVYLDLWQMDAFAGYKDLPRKCALDKAYFLDPSLGWGAPAFVAPGRVNGWYQLAAAGWNLFAAKVQGEPTIRFKAYVNGVWVGDYTVTGAGIMPILVNLPAGWNWVRFEQVSPLPSMGAFISLKAWKL